MTERAVVTPRRARLWIVGLLALAICAHVLRGSFVGAFFSDGGAGPEPELSQPASAQAGGLAPVGFTRVVLIDGLGLELARRLPNLDRVCANGLDLTVDVGFPTVSLPVQSALWTGRTQVESGIMYRIPQLEVPPPDALPHNVPQSHAIAESHAEMVHSFGFARVEPEADAEDTDLGSPWRGLEFPTRAEAIVAGDAPLAFVHVLRVDELGHAYGAESGEYTEAAEWADQLVGRLFDAGERAHPRDTRWFVVADHGHRPAGGHGGAESHIRFVRGCIVGRVPAELRGGTVHLVDVHRAIAESVGADSSAQSSGRPLAFALERPDLGATLPRPAGLAWALAGLLVVAALVVSFVATRARLLHLPWWLLIAYGGVVVIEGWPTLSNPMVYPPLGSDMVLAALPGAAILMVAAASALRTESIARVAWGQLSLPVGLLLASLSLCGAIAAVLGLSDRPPLMPLWTAHASLFFSLCLVGAGAVVVALGHALVSGRSRPKP